MRSDEVGAEQAAAGLCPACGADAARPIVYGMPLDDEVERRGNDVVFAGCCIPAEPPRFSCGRCHTSWGRFEWPDDPTADEESDPWTGL